MILLSPTGWRAASGAATSVSELVRHRSERGCDDVYLESARGGRMVTYGELHRVVARWGSVFEELDIGPGTVVGLALSDPVDLALMFLAVLASGRTVAPLDHSATDGELVAACTRTAPMVVISDRTGPSGAPTDWLTTAPGACPLPATRSAERTARDAGGRSGGRRTCANPDAATGGAAGVVLSTSGTTGVPKVIRLDEARLLHTACAVAGHFELAPFDRCFNALPLFHINAEVVGLLATLVSGGTIVLDDRFHRRGFWSVVAHHRVTWINAVPAILARLAVLEAGERVPDGIRFARSASAPLPVPVLERFERVTGIPVVETYGMTEAASQITANPLAGRRRPGSVGLPVGCEVRVVDGSGAPGAPGEVGRVGIRGPGVISAYSSPGHADRVDPAGWLDTGDLGYRDADGYLFLVGRADDVINRGGEKVYPKEVEDVVFAEPAVRSVAVVGRDHEVLGQVPVAYLILDGVESEDDESLAAALVDRIQRNCTRLLSRTKWPAEYHVVDRFPQGATGKVRRGALSGTPTVFSVLSP
ncbi:MAG TPA: AMP-binding protein [Acidimicrobiales bacterium]|nr:AMP-binding protein [Acidimicrobiales bacterium]